MKTEAPSLTADTITTEQIRELLRELLAQEPRSIAVSGDIRSAGHALGYSSTLIEDIDCRMPLGMEAEYERRGRARCAEILNARTGRTASPDDDRIYPCRECPTMRTKAEGGTVFTVCDECWDRLHPKRVPADAETRR